jgi:hypothetical protein
MMMVEKEDETIGVVLSAHQSLQEKHKRRSMPTTRKKKKKKKKKKRKSFFLHLRSLLKRTKGAFVAIPKVVFVTAIRHVSTHAMRRRQPQIGFLCMTTQPTRAKAGMRQQRVHMSTM